VSGSVGDPLDDRMVDEGNVGRAAAKTRVDVPQPSRTVAYDEDQIVVAPRRRLAAPARSDQEDAQDRGMSLDPSQCRVDREGVAGDRRFGQPLTLRPGIPRP
jgi:hypothetical protein